MNSVQDLSDTIGIMLNQFKLTFKRLTLLSNQATIFVVEDFGVMVCCVTRANYSQAENKLGSEFTGWRTVYISVEDYDLNVKYEILWELMRCGYMKWLRYRYPRQTKSLLLGTENLAHRIIKERLRLWGNRPKYKFLVEDNTLALKNNLSTELSQDPSFFDYMPEGDGGYVDAKI